MSNVTADEAVGNLLNVIKVEKQLGEEIGNVDDMGNMMFKNEEGFIPENLPVCKWENKNFDVFKVEKEKLCEESSLKEENLEKMEDQKVLLKEEIEINTDESDFCRLEEDAVLPRSEVTSGLGTRLELLMPNLKRELLKPYHKLKCTKKNVSRISMYKCYFCSYQAKYKFKLKIHELIHKDPSDVTMYKCNSCLFQTKYKVNLKRHSVKHKDTFEVTTYKCASCSFQTRHRDHLKRHLLQHKDPSEITMYRCDFCSYQARVKDSVERHLLTHKDPSEVIMYKCDFCSYETRHKHCLKRHLLTRRIPHK